MGLRRLHLSPLAACLAGVCVLAAPSAASDGSRIAQPPGGTFVADEAIVRFEPGATAGERLDARRAAGVSFERSLKVGRAQLVDVGGGVRAAVARLERQPGVAYAQPNYRYQASALPPNDTFFADLWGLEDSPAPDPGVGALSAWDTTRGEGQVIAIVDTGVALDHPDIASNVWTGPGDVHGHDFVDGDSDPDDYNFHGTHVAGTAAAAADNGLGVAGVAPAAEIMAVRVLDGDGSGSSADIGDGIAFAAQNGADVINLSLGGPSGVDDAFMSNAVTVADGLNAVVVAAAGNDANDNDADADATTPCTLPQANLICVAAVNRSGGLASFSSFGAASVDVGAPGTSILSARTDYAALLEEDFEGSLTAWDAFTRVGSVAWARTTDQAASGTHSATDSPGGDYADDSDSELFTAAPLDLTAERGCRVQLNLLYDIEEPDADDGSLFDYLFVGGVTNDIGTFDGLPFAGKSFGYDSGTFGEEEASISELDGRSDVFPFLGLFSDQSVHRDGAYADDLRVLCRDSSYLDDKTEAGSYVTFQGTSMATPHVAGVAALVRAADPGISDTQVVEAIEAGGTPLASLAGKTTSGRTADAAGAIAVALGVPNAPPAQAVSPSSTISGVTVAPPSGPAKPDLRGAKARIRASRGGRFAYRFRATPALTGRVAFRRVGAAIGRARFTVGSRGRVAVEVKLSRRDLRRLRRRGKLALGVTVVVRDAAGLSATAGKRLTLLAPRR
jgi:thermitase